MLAAVSGAQTAPKAVSKASATATPVRHGSTDARTFVHWQARQAVQRKHSGRRAAVLVAAAGVCGWERALGHGMG